MNIKNFWIYYNAVEAFAIKEFYIIVSLLLFGIVYKTVIEKNNN